MTKDTIASDDYILDMFEERFQDCGNLMTEDDAQVNDKVLRNERIQDNTIVKETITNVEDGNIPMEQSMVVYDAIHEELRAKTQLLKKAKKKIQALYQEMSDLQKKFETERTNYLEKIRKQNQQIQLQNQIIDKIQPLIWREYNYSNIQKIRTKCYWDEENHKWNIPELVAHKKKLTPGVQTGKRPNRSKANDTKYFDDSSDEEFFRELEEIQEDIAGPSFKRRRQEQHLGLGELNKPKKCSMTRDTVASSVDSSNKSNEGINKCGKLTTECGTHSNDKGFEGETDNTITKGKGNMKSISPVTTSKCKFCDFVCSSQAELLNHYKIHPNQKLHTCGKCGKTFKYETNLKRHLSAHSNERPFTCELCGRAYKEIYHLSKHMQFHRTETTSTNNKPYKCKDCGKSFTEKYLFTFHLAVHSDERPYSCDICMSRFKLKRHLQKHLLIHKNYRPYKCETCGSAFKRGDHLNQHVLTVHEKKKKVDLYGIKSVSKS